MDQGIGIRVQTSLIDKNKDSREGLFWQEKTAVLVATGAVNTRFLRQMEYGREYEFRGLGS